MGLNGNTTRKTCDAFKGGLAAVLILFVNSGVQSQRSPLYDNLPVGKYSVGFSILTVADSNRISQPEYNYLGEKNEGDRSRKITIQIWYPSAEKTGRRKVKFGDYSHYHLLSTTNEAIDDKRKVEQIINWRRSLERFFGKTSDVKWDELVSTPMLATEDATGLPGRFPLLIGLMRPFTTAMTNELLASHGYIVAMIKKQEPGDDDWAKYARFEIPDMQFAMSYLARKRNFDQNKIGTFGFSGAGFVPVLFAMHDTRVKAVADIESLMYFDRDNLFQLFAKSDYYNPANLRVPFMHVFGLESAKKETFITEFEYKTKFSKRYRLLFNHPEFTHADFTMQGYALAAFLKNRGANQDNISKSFELSNIYLLNFFNAELKADAQAKSFLSGKPELPQYPSLLWDINVLDPVKPAPQSNELEYIIRKKGIEEALGIVRATIKNDSSSNILRASVLNNLGYTFLSEKKFEEAIGIFKLNTELHPTDPNLFDSLAEGYETSGDPQKAKAMAVIVMELLNKKTNLTDAEKNMKANAQKRM
jgi:hypothetical protein